MWKIAIIPFLFILLVWTWQFINWVWVKPKRTERFFRKQGMKGNSYKLLYGDSREADLMYKKAYSKPLSFGDDILPRVMPNIVDTIKKYGNYSFMWSGPRPRVFVLDPDVIRDVLSKYRQYHKAFKVNNPVAKMLVTGLASMEGDEWFKYRMRVNPAFQLHKLKSMVSSIQLCCENILKDWKETAAKGGGSCVIDVCNHLEVYTGSVLSQLMFTSPYTEKIRRTFNHLSELESLGKLATNIFSLPGQKYFPTKINRRAKEIQSVIEVSFTSMINERLEKRKAGGDTDARDLLDIFMEELYEGKVKNERERRKIIGGIIGQCKIFFFAGYETSSNLLTWTMIYLSIHQEWQVRAREEALEVLGKNNTITSSDVGKLKIITMILNEMLRLYPAGMEFSRVVEEETKLGEYIIPKDTLITCPILMLNFSPEIWGEDAAKFNPGRFAEGPARAAKVEAPYMPFGWGPRTCIAQNFALLETKTFMAMLLRDFSLELSPTYVHAPFVDFTIHPQYGAPIVLKRL